MLGVPDDAGVDAMPDEPVGPAVLGGWLGAGVVPAKVEVEDVVFAGGSGARLDAGVSGVVGVAVLGAEGGAADTLAASGVAAGGEGKRVSATRGAGPFSAVGSRFCTLWSMPKRSRELTEGDAVPESVVFDSPFTSKKRAKRLDRSVSGSSWARSWCISRFRRSVSGSWPRLPPCLRRSISRIWALNASMASTPLAAGRRVVGSSDIHAGT